MSVAMLLDVVALLLMFLAASAEFQRRIADVNFVALSLAIWMLARLIRV